MTLLSKKDYKTDQDVRWCPGCGDYGILNAVQSAFAKTGRSKHETVVVSGIGCSSRFPYYMETFGFHGIHGRAAPIATGVKVANPDLDVWVITGDGDGLSIGGNHFLHACRRNVGLKMLLFNNRIYGLTKGQYSPTSEQGKLTKSSPLGSVDYPLRPINLALAARATFVARSIDMFGPHLESVIMQAAEHEGLAFVEIIQNCNIFNDGAFDSFRSKDVRARRTVQLEHGKPLLFGENKEFGLRVDCDLKAEVIEIGKNGATEADAMVWDEGPSSPAVAMAMATLSEADFPVPIGVFRRVQRPPFERLVNGQVQQAMEKKGEQSLQEMLDGPDTWVVS